MKQIIKRLELIKTAIAIEDEEIIELQVMKLQKMELDDRVVSILQSLETLDYADAILSIEHYIKRYS